MLPVRVGMTDLKPLKIAILTDAYYPHVSGVARTIESTTNELVKRGHEVLIIAPRDFKYKVRAPKYPEIELVLFPDKKLTQLLDEFSPDSIHLSVEGPIGMAGKRYAKKRKLHFTTAYHTRFPEYVRIQFGIPEWLTYAIVRNFHKDAAHVMVASERLKQELADHGIRNGTLWNRGVDTELFSPENPHPLTGERPLFMYMGRVGSEKNLDAFLSLSLPGTKYIVGDGPERHAFQTRYPDAVFTGYKFGKELAQHLAAADVFVFPSLTDTLGLVMLEANACGVPIATYPSQASDAVVVEGVNGVVREDLKEACLEALKLSREKCREHALSMGWAGPTDLFLGNLVRAGRDR
ncbi:MAG: glycosyltransferase family 1 protein [Minisyncoccia bacterium]